MPKRRPPALASRKPAQNEALNSREAKGAIEEKLRSEPGLESKDIQVTLTADAVKLSDLWSALMTVTRQCESPDRMPVIGKSKTI